MALEDSVCTFVPYFVVQDGKLDDFRALTERMVEKTRGEDGVLFYAFSFSGRQAHCREGYRNADDVLAHLDNVSELIDDALRIAKLDRLEVHAPAAEVAKLEEPLKELSPTFFVLETGFRRS